MTRALIVLVLTLGLIVEMSLRLTVFLVIACTIIGLSFLCWRDTTQLLVTPSLGSLVTKVLESP